MKTKVGIDAGNIRGEAVVEWHPYLMAENDVQARIKVLVPKQIITLIDGYATIDIPIDNVKTRNIGSLMLDEPFSPFLLSKINGDWILEF